MPPEVRTLLDDAFKTMEDKGIFHSDLHLGNFLYSAKDRKIYPLDISTRRRSDMVEGDPLPDDLMDDYELEKADLYHDFNKLLIAS